MKKKILSSICALVVCFGSIAGLTSCKKKTNKGMITAKPLTVKELGEGFNEDYLPDTSSIRALSGNIDVCLDFEGTQAGWKELAKEYERLQGGGVTVNIDDTYIGSTYSDRLNQELTNPNTGWDIVEGNLGYGNTPAHCIDMYANVSSVNPYCGKDVKWEAVLKPEAYRTKEADTSKTSIIMNTEVMQTCWFVNDVAFQAAVSKGYKNAANLPAYPITWDDLINLCAKMEEAGYTNPLGITLCNASIESLQFTWLLRVYGDYYYRQFYEYIMGGKFGEKWENYDPKAPVVEKNSGYGVQHAKLLAILFNKNLKEGPGYVGFTSEVYLDFVSQLAKMKGHLIQNVESTEFGSLRDKFETQTDKSAPQIILDYQGFGINYEKIESDKFKVGYFDYPTMVSGKYQSGVNKGKSIVPTSTITRDIGGNGGFVSIVNHLGDAAQNELNKDFIKFVLSPYGQTVYYKGLASANKVPKGLSTVKNELVVIPSEWVSFFNESNKTIKFSGDVDANPFLTWGVRYTNGKPAGQKIICDNWRGLLMDGLSADQTLAVGAFAVRWDTAAYADAQTMVTENKWNSKVWTDPNFTL